jgi:hypothetical protein
MSRPPQVRRPTPSWPPALVAAEQRITDPDTGGEKGQKPQRMDLLPWDALMWGAEHFHVGAAKYEDRNWERGYKHSLSFAALQRHLGAYWQGEDLDPETQSHHLQAAFFHICVLMAFTLRDAGTDDRPNTTHSTGDTT